MGQVKMAKNLANHLPTMTQPQIGQPSLGASEKIRLSYLVVLVILQCSITVEVHLNSGGQKMENIRPTRLGDKMNRIKPI